MVSTPQLKEDGIHVDRDDLRVRQAAGEPGGQGPGSAAQVEQERPATNTGGAVIAARSPPCRP
ncbi:hypothetical protein [Streptomyces wedmorensis]|uniref:hypothetical protein n=1 Tax=Streptomyces wedmorensis TaxID=43759 RepID=UPI003F4CCE46